MIGRSKWVGSLYFGFVQAIVCYPICLRRNAQCDHQTIAATNAGRTFAPPPDE